MVWYIDNQNHKWILLLFVTTIFKIKPNATRKWNVRQCLIIFKLFSRSSADSLSIIAVSRNIIFGRCRASDRAFHDELDRRKYEIDKVDDILDYLNPAYSEILNCRLCTWPSAHSIVKHTYFNSHFLWLICTLVRRNAMISWTLSISLTRCELKLITPLKCDSENNLSSDWTEDLVYFER